jgi:hypothetical protein
MFRGQNLQFSTFGNWKLLVCVVMKIVSKNFCTVRLPVSHATFLHLHFLLVYNTLVGSLGGDGA